MLLTIKKYSDLHGAHPRTVRGYIKRGLLHVSHMVEGIHLIDSDTPLPKVHNGWPKGKPRKKKEPNDLDKLIE